MVFFQSSKCLLCVLSVHRIFFLKFQCSISSINLHQQRQGPSSRKIIKSLNNGFSFFSKFECLLFSPINRSAPCVLKSSNVSFLLSIAQQWFSCLLKSECLLFFYNRSMALFLFKVSNALFPI
jgi:hypothetical protein